MARSITYQIGQALKYLHSHKIIHRDIKLENIMLSNHKPTCAAKLADFGLAQPLETKGNRAGGSIGTFGYQAPEVMKGKVIGTPSDIWQLGCLLFAMLTVTLPVGTGEGDHGNPNTRDSSVYYDNVAVNIDALDNSDSCKDLLRGMLAINQKTRLTIEQVLEHPFFTS